MADLPSVEELAAIIHDADLAFDPARNPVAWRMHMAEAVRARLLRDAEIEIAYADDHVRLNLASQVAFAREHGIALVSRQVASFTTEWVEEQ